MRLKYSNARRSSWVTPSPSAYIRPSLNCAIGWPPSAAYCSEFSETSVEDDGTAFFRAPAAPNINAKMIRLDVRITLFLVRAARMGHGPIHCGSNLLGILPQRA